jgi:hypothetical protein
MRWRWLLLAAFPLATSAVADPQLSLPIACTPGRDCFILSYVDAEMSTAAMDFACGSLSADGNTSTNIDLESFAAMEAGVDVLAAAPGTVVGLRDGLPDTGAKGIDPSMMAERAIGNALIIDHGDGWVTGYGHLKQGSIIVKPGDKVAEGQKLGSVGFSGAVNFPLLSFEVRHDGRPIDPFTGEPMAAGCGIKPHSLWKSDLAYIPIGLLRAGFAIERPVPDAARHGAYDQTVLAIEAPALTFWAEVFGLRTGDRLELRVTGPDGAILKEVTSPLDRPHPDLFAFAGAPRPSRGWQSGPYVGRIQVIRGDQILIEETRQIALP